MINEFHATESEHSALKLLLAVLKKMINFSGRMKALWKIKRLRPRVEEIKNRKLLIKKDDICATRLEYLRIISCYTNEGCPIIYTNKMYIHSSHTKVCLGR
jgi:diphthamide synthase subunit DPH2